MAEHPTGSWARRFHIPSAPEEDPGVDPAAGQDGIQDEPGRTVARAARSMDHGVLRTVFQDLVGRPPYAAEYESWMGKGLAELLDDLLGSPEFWQQWWEEQLYYFLLIDGFRPEMDSAREVPRKLAEGRLSARDAVHRLALTSSFDLRNPGADTFVTVVMEQICGMTVQKATRDLEIGKHAYDGGSGRFLGTTAKSQADVVRICVEHKRSSLHLLAREYERLIKRSADPGKLAAWARQQHRDPYSYLSLVREWFLSDGYLDRLATTVSKPNRLFIRGLFVDLLGRLPTAAEMEPMRYALDGLSDSRPLRSVLVRLLLDSGRASLPTKISLEDPTAWTSEQFQRLLGRPALPQELETFVSIFHQDDCQPATIMYALLTTAEYHRY
ncbi:MAG: hypothetical protein V3T22_04240 [Planctomycetota bacterium]